MAQALTEQEPSKTGAHQSGNLKYDMKEHFVTLPLYELESAELCMRVEFLESCLPKELCPPNVANGSMRYDIPNKEYYGSLRRHISSDECLEQFADILKTKSAATHTEGTAKAGALSPSQSTTSSSSTRPCSELPPQAAS